MTDPSSRVEEAASSNIDGYLRNALRRVRAPAEEGGRGTRRRLEMVTSLNVNTMSALPFAPIKNDEVKVELEATGVVVDDDGDEWDVVAITSSATTKPEVGPDQLPALSDHVVQDAGIVHATDAVSKTDDAVTAVKSDSSAPSAKVELKWSVKNEEGASAARLGNKGDPSMGTHADEGEGDGFDMQWARPTLTSIGTSNHQTAPGQHRAITREMEDEREAAKAKAKSDRVLRAAGKVTELLVIIQRYIRVMRETNHVVNWKHLLHIRNHSRKGEGERRSLFGEAICQAKGHMSLAQGRTPAPSLAPCWVTSKSDTVKNETSSAITTLLLAMKQVVRLHTPDIGGEAPPFHPLEPFEPRLLSGMLKRLCQRSSQQPGQAPQSASSPEVEDVPSPIYLCMIFLMQCHLAGMCARLVIAWDPYPTLAVQPDAEDGAPHLPAGRGGRGGARVQLMTTVAPKEPASRGGRGGRGRGGRGSATSNKPTTASVDNEEAPPLATPKPPTLPETYCWCEVWCPVRQSWISVNPCAESARVAWDLPYSLAFGRGGVVVDVAARYTSKYSALLQRQLDAKEHLSPHYLWRRIPKDVGASTTYLAVLLKGRLPTDRFPSSPVALHQWGERERQQLDKLMYAEPVPNTLGALKRHPLYVVEQDAGRWEGVFPKDATTIVGSVRGLLVFKRSALVSLRSRDGWLRVHRSLKSGDEQAYKVVPPPPSRPFAPPSNFFGRWQTVPFEPRPLRDDGTIERHGNSTWYILLRGSSAPEGITHLNEPHIARVARKMKVDFANAVVAFVKRHAAGANRRGSWDAQIEGIVVPSAKAAAVAHAYAQWVALTAQEAAAKRRQRALKWWAHLIQQRLAVHRLEAMYDEGERRRKKRHRSEQ